MKKLLKNKKALSPVVAAIILIAVTVAVSIAVAAWMGSMTFTFMETEQITITGLDFNSAGTPTVYTIDVSAINTGTTDIIISDVSVTGMTSAITYSPATITQGTTSQTITLTLGGTDSWTTGNSYTVKLVSSKGNVFSFTATA